MRLIKPSFEIWEQSPGEIGIYKQIERAGRVCYKSEDRLAEDSYVKFVEMLKSHAHGAMLEHGTVYLKVPMYYANCVDSPCEGLDVVLHSPYSKVKYKPAPELEGFVDWTGREIDNECYYITTNYRVIVENNLEHLLKFLCEPTEFHEKRVTIRFTTDRGVSHEFVRHRVFSFAQESTRYCNYSKDKFGNELTFIIPSWLAIEEGSYGIGHSFGKGHFYECNENRIYCDEKNKEEFFKVLNFLKILNLSSQVYMSMLNTFGLTPQQARQVLPNALKTELVMTGFVSDWKHFFELRCDQSAHPDAKALAIPLRDEFLKRGLIE